MPPSSLRTELQQSQEERSRWQREAEAQAAERQRLAAELQERHRQLEELREAARDREEQLGAAQVGTRLISPPHGAKPAKRGILPQNGLRGAQLEMLRGAFYPISGCFAGFFPSCCLLPNYSPYPPKLLS